MILSVQIWCIEKCDGLNVVGVCGYLWWLLVTRDYDWSRNEVVDKNMDKINGWWEMKMECKLGEHK